MDEFVDENLDDLTDDEDFLELLYQEIFPRRSRIFRERINHFIKWEENEFRSRFRLSKQTVNFIIGEIKEDIVCLKNL